MDILTVILWLLTADLTLLLCLCTYQAPKPVVIPMGSLAIDERITKPLAAELQTFAQSFEPDLFRTPPKQGPRELGHLIAAYPNAAEILAALEAEAQPAFTSPIEAKHFAGLKLGNDSQYRLVRNSEHGFRLERVLNAAEEAA